MDKKTGGYETRVDKTGKYKKKKHHLQKKLTFLLKIKVFGK